MYSNHILEIGLKRKENQDFLLVDEAEKFGIFVVADGMGGHSFGKEASEIAIDAIGAIWNKHQKNIVSKTYSTDYIFRLLKYAFDMANYNIFKINNEKNTYMGTTLTAVIILDNKALVMHVGDCRVYFLRGHDVKQLTADDTKIYDEFKNGFISQAYYEEHQADHRLVKCIGIRKKIIPQFYEIELRMMDQIFLCSDGIHQYFNKELLEDVLTRRRILEIEDKLKVIKEIVENEGASDNYCAILVEI